jgi:hypothetical protein
MAGSEAEIKLRRNGIKIPYKPIDSTNSDTKRIERAKLTTMEPIITEVTSILSSMGSIARKSLSDLDTMPNLVLNIEVVTRIEE